VADLTADGQPAASAGRAPKKRAVQAAPARQRPKPCAETAVVLKAEMAGELAALRARYLDAGAHGGTTWAHYLDARVRELPEEFQCEGAETMDAPARIEKYPRIHQALSRFCGRRKRPADADLTELLLLRRLRGWEAGGAARGEAAPCVDHILGARRSLLGIIAPKFRHPRSAPATLNPRLSAPSVLAGLQPDQVAADDVVSLDLEGRPAAAAGQRSWRPIDIDAAAMEFWEVHPTRNVLALSLG
jgi:hypothetical protein